MRGPKIKKFFFSLKRHSDQGQHRVAVENAVAISSFKTLLLRRPLLWAPERRRWLRCRLSLSRRASWCEPGRLASAAAPAAPSSRWAVTRPSAAHQRVVICAQENEAHVHTLQVAAETRVTVL